MPREKSQTKLAAAKFKYSVFTGHKKLMVNIKFKTLKIVTITAAIEPRSGGELSSHRQIV